MSKTTPIVWRREKDISFLYINGEEVGSVKPDQRVYVWSTRRTTLGIPYNLDRNEHRSTAETMLENHCLRSILFQKKEPINFTWSEGPLTRFLNISGEPVGYVVKSQSDKFWYWCVHPTNSNNIPPTVGHKEDSFSAVMEIQEYCEKHL